jgi:outer membrane protein assembly factor BamE (lipoprotein component of BamABCDE complex)
MIEDLLRRHRFDGWTRQQVVELLGQPTGKWSGFEQWDMIYVLGLERGGAFSLDDEALGFKFDTRDRVMKYGLSVN